MAKKKPKMSHPMLTAHNDFTAALNIVESTDPYYYLNPNKKNKIAGKKKYKA